MLSEFGFHFVPEITPTTLALLVLVIVWWIRGMPDRKRANTEADQAIIDAYAKFNSDLLTRVSTLEEELVSERKRCMEVEQDLRSEIRGLQRQFISYQVALGRALPPEMQSAEFKDAIEAAAISAREEKK